MTGAPQPSRRFELALPGGSAWLELGAPGAGSSASGRASGLEFARALAPALGLLATLESWLGAPFLALHPRDETPPAWPQECDALTLPLAPEAAPAGGRLVLPWRALPTGRRPPAAMPWRWPRWAVELRLQSLPDPRLPEDAIAPGAMLLLPQSFGDSDTWPVDLLPLAGPLAALTGGRWRPRDGSLLASACRPMPAAPVPAWQVVLDDPVTVDARCWFGGSAETLVAAPARVRLLHHGGFRARGQLIPCGLGWGLQIETTSPAPVDTATATA